MPDVYGPEVQKTNLRKVLGALSPDVLPRDKVKVKKVNIDKNMTQYTKVESRMSEFYLYK